MSCESKTKVSIHNTASSRDRTYDLVVTGLQVVMPLLDGYLPGNSHALVPTELWKQHLTKFKQ